MNDPSYSELRPSKADFQVISLLAHWTLEIRPKAVPPAHYKRNLITDMQNGAVTSARLG